MNKNESVEGNVSRVALVETLSDSARWSRSGLGVAIGCGVLVFWLVSKCVCLIMHPTARVLYVPWVHPRAPTSLFT